MNHINDNIIKELNLIEKPLNPFLLTEKNADKYYDTYFALLAQLTPSVQISKDIFLTSLKRVLGHTIIVIIVDEKSTVIGSASVIVEEKLIKGGCKVVHLEDVIVDKQVRQKGYGKLLVETCKSLAKKVGCFKMILDCGEKNVQFYKNCGFNLSGIEMNHIFQ